MGCATTKDWTASGAFPDTSRIPSIDESKVPEAVPLPADGAWMQRRDGTWYQIRIVD